MSDDALLATMTELANYLTLRSEHRVNIEEAQQALAGLEDEIDRLRAELAGHLRSEVLQIRWQKGRPKGSKDKQKRGAYRPVRRIASAPALEALETIKASGPEGVPLDKLETKPWVIGLLARAHYARKLPNGNWVAA